MKNGTPCVVKGGAVSKETDKKSAVAAASSLKLNEAPTLPTNVAYVLGRLTVAGYGAYTVGGCVRDFLRGVTPHDYDVTTSARPEEIHTVFADDRLIDTGIAHGTVTVLADGEPIEVTTYRIDGDYRDSRHPESVSFTDDIEKDLSRRDFTMNAIAYHPVVGFCDPFGGRKDITAGVIRAVGDPRARFSEDALRILRALRFSAVLDFAIEEDTARAAIELCPLLLRISPERVRVELVKLLTGIAAPRVLLEYTEIFRTLLPAWERGISKWDAPSVAAVLSCLPPDPILRLVVFLLPLSEGEDDRALARTLLTDLRFDNRTRDRVLKLLSHLADPYAGEGAVLRRFLSGLGEEDALLMLTLHRAIAKAASAPDAVFALIEEARTGVLAILASGACLSIADLALRGDDLIAEGFSAGRRLGEILHALFDAVLDGTCPNERAALLAYARRHFS